MNIGMLAFFLMLGTMVAAAQDKTLTIRIDGTHMEGKNIYVALYRKDDEFPSEKTAFKATIIVGNHESTTVSFDVPYGEYAAAIYLDENENGKLDKNSIGFPKEPFGFSNNFRPKLGKPKFKNCKFSFSEQTPQTAIKIKG